VSINKLTANSGRESRILLKCQPQINCPVYNYCNFIQLCLWGLAPGSPYSCPPIHYQRNRGWHSESETPVYIIPDCSLFQVDSPPDTCVHAHVSQLTRHSILLDGFLIANQDADYIQNQPVSIFPCNLNALDFCEIIISLRYQRVLIPFLRMVASPVCSVN